MCGLKSTNFWFWYVSSSKHICLTLHSCSKVEQCSTQDTCSTPTSYSQWELYLLVKQVCPFPGSSGTSQIDWMDPMRECSVCNREVATTDDLQFLSFSVGSLPDFPNTLQSDLLCKDEPCQSLFMVHIWSPSTLLCLCFLSTSCSLYSTPTAVALLDVSVVQSLPIFICGSFRCVQWYPAQTPKSLAGVVDL